MKSMYVVALAVLVAVYADEKYTPENDNFDIDTAVANMETIKAFVNCFTDKAECDAVSADFKKDLGEAILQACLKCTDAQKHIFKVFIDALKAKHPTGLDSIKQLHDPENKHFPALEAALAKS